MLFKRQIRNTLLAFAIISGSQGVTAMEYTPLAPTTTHEITTIEVLEKLQVMHFSSVAIDDDLAKCDFCALPVAALKANLVGFGQCRELNDIVVVLLLHRLPELL